MHFKMVSAISFNLDQTKILSSGNGLTFDLSTNFSLDKNWKQWLATYSYSILGDDDFCSWKS